MINKVQKEIRKYEVISSGDKILVALSGGPDSLALVDILNKIKDELNISIHAAHLNHMFRGEEAAGDANFVKEFCENRRIPVTVESINVKEYMQKTGLSSQVGAREVRYDFLNKTAIKEGCNKIALGHHADDQAETILMNIMRGSGSKGLKGIELVNRQYIRPLLFVRRKEIEEYCQKNNLEPRTDSSNLKDVYLRNKIRHHLIPYLEQDFNPNIVEALNQTAMIIKDEFEYIEDITKDIFNKFIVKEDNVILFNRLSFNSLATAIQRRLLIRIWTELTGDNRGLDFIHIEKTIRFISEGPSNGRIDLPRGFACKSEYETIKISRLDKEDLRSPKVGNYMLIIPGKTVLEGLDKTIECRVSNDKVIETRKSNEILIDLDKVIQPLVVRGRMPGDIIRIKGLSGSKKLKDFLIDLKIPVKKRDEIPILYDQQGIIWVGGIRECSGYEVDESTTKYLSIILENYSS